MRIAVLILGLVLGVIMFFQTFLVTSLSGLSKTPGATYSAGSIGLVMAVLWLIGVALVIPVPLVSVVAFVLAGILGYANSTHFSDLAVWGGASIILAVLSLIGWFTKRRGTRRQEEREAQRHAEVVASVSQPAPASVACPSCATWNAQGSRFCSECGTALSAATLTTN
jgi:hypothetical protein